MKLIQWNLKHSLLMSTCFLAIGIFAGFCYHFRFGYELMTPPPLPTRPVPPEIRAGINPKPCVGFHPEQSKWGRVRQNCPKNYAFMANDTLGGEHKEGPGEYVSLQGWCCPLPAEDILTDIHTYASTEECPDQSVVTGGIGPCTSSCTMRCTQINTKKYRLGNETQAYYVKSNQPKFLLRRFHNQGSAERVHWEQLPESIRYGVGRLGASRWNSTSCVGVPLGSLLTRKVGKRCDGFYYRELLYADGVPVAMLPDCEVLSDPFIPNPTCLREEEREQAVEAIVRFK